MHRTEMVCGNCIKFDGIKCGGSTRNRSRCRDRKCTGVRKGQWRQWSERYQEMEPYYWGEWEEEL